MSTMDIQPRWYTVRQAAEALGYSLSKTKTLVKTGRLKSVKDGGSRRIIPKWIDDYIASRAAEVEELYS